MNPVMKFGAFIVTDEKSYNWYWMGKSPIVRKAVEAYISRTRLIWNAYKGETQYDVAEEFGVHPVSVGVNFRKLKSLKLIELDEEKLNSLLMQEGRLK